MSGESSSLALEAYRLRREEQHDAALAAARRAREADAEDPFAVGALAWCLISSAWNDLRRNDRVSAQQRLEELDRLPRCEKKNDLLGPACERLREALQNGAAIRDVRERLKACAERLRADPSSGDAVGREALAALRDYAGIPGVRRSGLTHSLVLYYATRLAPALPRYVEFVQWWNIELLRDEDYRPRPPKNPDDRPLPALAERVCGALYRALRGHPDAERHAPWVDAFFGKCVATGERYVWLPYYYGQWLNARGRLAEARELLRPFARRHPADFWAWAALAAAYRDEPADEAALLCRAARCPVQNPEQLAGVRSDLVKAWRRCGEFDAARREAAAILALNIVRNPERRAEIERAAAADEPARPDEKHEALIARALARAAAIVCPLDSAGIVLSRNEKKNVVAIALDRDRVALAHYDRLPAARDLRPGETVRIALDDAAKPDRPARVLALARAELSEPLPFVRAFEGALRKNPRGFAFVGRAYVPPELAAGLTEGPARALAVERPIPDKPGQYGWTALAVECPAPPQKEETPCPA